MDDIKDIRRSDSLSRFLDGHAVRTNPFGRNASGEKSYRRAERLVAALCLLTSHVPESESIRQSVRVTGTRLLSDILALRDEMRIPNSSKIYAAQSTVRKLISLVRMLAVSGLISIQNADITVEAIDELGNFLTLSQRTPLSESIVLSREELLSGGLIAEKRTNLSVKDKTLMPKTQTDRNVRTVTDSRYIKDSIKDAAIILRTDDAMGTRSREVLAVLRPGGELGIRDIASNLPEYSEKMIQRELASLVMAGRVKKTGLRRWSRYSVVGSA